MERLTKHLEASNDEKRRLDTALERTNIKLNYLATKHNESKEKIDMLERANKELLDRVMDFDLKHNKMIDIMKGDVEKTNDVKRKQLAAFVKSLSLSLEQRKKGETNIKLKINISTFFFVLVCINKL